MGEKILIQYENVEIQREENIILRDVSFEIGSGEFLYVIGKVGSGKSTLLKSMYCETPLAKGEGVVLGHDLRKIKRKEVAQLRKKLGIVFQDFQLLIDRSVEENLKFVLKATEWKNKTLISERIEEVLTQVEMQNKGYKMPHELSGGEQQRIVIARALLNSPELILADEPTGNLDPDTGRQIVLLLQEICNNGTSVIMSTHNHQLVHALPGKVKKCENGFLHDYTF